MFGNDGRTPIEVTEQQPDGSRKVVETYPCSTHDWLYLNDGCMTEAKMAEVIGTYIESSPEKLKPKAKRTEDELERDYAVALWILENDILNEDVLVEYTPWCEVGMACRGISDDLMEPFLNTTSRFSHRKARLEWHSMEANWHRFSPVSSFTIQRVKRYADESTNGEWRKYCPVLGGNYKKEKLSPCFHLLNSHSPETPGFNNNRSY